MAKKEEKPKIVLERVYIVPLRKEFQKVPPYRRTKKAVKALREFIAKHMKSGNVIIGKYANQLLWKNGIKNPPHHIKVTAIKDEKGKVSVELAELPPKAKRELEKDKQLKKKKEEKETEKKGEEAKKAKEEKKEEKAGEVKKEKEDARKSRISGTHDVGKAKEIEKEEIKELKKELPKQHMPKQPAIPKQVEQHQTAPKGQ